MKCPECGGDAYLIFSIAWHLGGAEKYKCSNCDKDFWFVQCNTAKPNSSFYLDGDKDPYYECMKRGLLSKPENKNILDYFVEGDEE